MRIYLIIAPWKMIDYRSCSGTVFFLVPDVILLGKGCLGLWRVFHVFSGEGWKNFTSFISTDSKYIKMHLREISLLTPLARHRHSAFWTDWGKGYVRKGAKNEQNNDSHSGCQEPCTSISSLFFLILNKWIFSSQWKINTMAFTSNFIQILFHWTFFSTTKI